MLTLKELVVPSRDVDRNNEGLTLDQAKEHSISVAIEQDRYRALLELDRILSGYDQVDVA